MSTTLTGAETKTKRKSNFDEAEILSQSPQVGCVNRDVTSGEAAWTKAQLPGSPIKKRTAAMSRYELHCASVRRRPCSAPIFRGTSEVGLAYCLVCSFA
jgi:hypothetical protein